MEHPNSDKEFYALMRQEAYKIDARKDISEKERKELYSLVVKAIELRIKGEKAESRMIKFIEKVGLNN